MEEDGYINVGRKEKRKKTVRKGNKDNIYIYMKREKEENRRRWWFVPQGADWGKENRIEGMITFVSYLTLERAG